MTTKKSTINSSPLPQSLINRYKDWKNNSRAELQDKYTDLADNGQDPEVMAISCGDSRVLVTQLFGVGPGDFFSHRNIANIVPPLQPEKQAYATSSALEFAVMHLQVRHIVVLGHSLCGGVAGCFDMCSGNAPAFEEPDSAIGRWIDELRPAFDALTQHDDREKALGELEREGVKMSLRNLMTYPFVADAVNENRLQIHGLWTDIRSGDLECYDPATDRFLPI